MTSRLALALGTAAALAAGTLAATSAPTAPAHAAAAAAAAGPTTTNGCLSSVPEPGSTATVKICYTIFRPAVADRRHRVPMVMHSHGWGGSRTTDPAAFTSWLRSGYGVISFDQRGFGQSGGQAHVENPAYEGADVRRLVRLVSTLRWVRQDGPGDP